jgi:hypothetical protein
MGTLALESRTTRRPALGWVLVTAAAVVVAIGLVLSLSSARPSSTGRAAQTITAGSKNLAIGGPTATGRPRAYHSRANWSCSRFTTLPKRGRVCIDPGKRSR